VANVLTKALLFPFLPKFERKMQRICICHLKSISEEHFVTTFQPLIAMCGKWRQGWTLPI